MTEGVRCCQLLLYLAQTPEVEALGRELKLTWVNRALLPFRVGDDLVFIHHLDVLVLHLITAGRERTEDSIKVWAAWPCHLSCLGLAGEVVCQQRETGTVRTDTEHARPPLRTDANLGDPRIDPAGCTHGR